MFILSACLFYAARAIQQLTYQEAWQKEQADRSKFRQVIYDSQSTPQDIQKALKGIQSVADWCASPGIRDLKNVDGVRNLYYQQNDILVDEISGYARLKDLDSVRKCVQTLHDLLVAPDSWLKGSDQAFFSTYASSITDNEYFPSLPHDPEIDRIVADLRRRDPNHIYRGLPYKASDTPNISASDRVAGLSMIWSEAKYNFANFDLVSDLDWDASYQKYLPLVAAAKDRYAYYNLLREFIGQLKDSHTDVALPQSLSVSKEFRPPLSVKLIEGKVVVWWEPSPDLKALGFQKGDLIEKIDGVDAVAYGQNKWGKIESSSTPQDRDIRIYTYMLLRGPLDAPVKLTVSTAEGRTVTRVLPRNKAIKGVTLASSEFRLLPDGTAYFAFNTCANDEPSESFEKHLPEIKAAGRLIIDCRMNDGGNSGVGYSILAHLIQKPVVVSQWQTPDYKPSYRVWGSALPPHKDSVSVTPEAPLFDGPVTVLTSARTFSAGEDFVAAFKMSKRGKLIGEATGGSTGQPLSFQLPGGGWARVCTKRDRMGDGTEFVGRGILPDLPVGMTIDAIRKNEDPILEAALRYVNKPQ